MSKWHDTFSVHSHFTPTKKSQWVKEKLRVNLPADYPAESYPGFSASLAVKSQHSKTLTYSLTKSFQDAGLRWQGVIYLSAFMNPVTWFEIYVEDLASAKVFYESVFNYSLSAEKPTVALRPSIPWRHAWKWGYGRFDETPNIAATT